MNWPRSQPRRCVLPVAALVFAAALTCCRPNASERAESPGTPGTVGRRSGRDAGASQKSTLDRLAAQDREDWEAARKANTPQSYTRYLAEHPQGAFAGQARSGAESASFEQARRSDTEPAFEEFLGAYPHGRFSPDAADRLEQLRYDQARAEDDIPRYEYFLAHHPNGRFSGAVRFRLQQLRYRQVLQTGSEGEVEDFLVRYPAGPYHQALKARLSRVQFERATRVDRDEAYIEFLLSHPAGKEAPAAVARLQDHTFRHVEAPWTLPWGEVQGVEPDMEMVGEEYPISVRPGAFSPPPVVEPGKPYLKMGNGIYLREDTLLFFDVLTEVGPFRCRGSARVGKKGLVFQPGSVIIRRVR